MVYEDNTVDLRYKSSKRLQEIRVKNVTFDDESGNADSGDLYRLVPTSADQVDERRIYKPEEVYISSENYQSMTAEDFLIIILLGDQPFRFSLSEINDEMDQMLDQLEDPNNNIAFRLDKIKALGDLRTEVKERYEEFILYRPVGL